jgi:hypothetical protein
MISSNLSLAMEDATAAMRTSVSFDEYILLRGAIEYPETRRIAKKVRISSWVTLNE